MGQPHITARASRAVQQGWKALKDNGIAGTVASLILGALATIFAWMHDHLPFSVICLIGVGAFALVGNGYYHFRLARAVRGFDPAKARELGMQITDFTRRANRTFADYDRAHPHIAEERGDPSAEWHAARRRDSDRANEFVRQHMGEAVACLATLSELGIHVPFHAGAGATHRPEGLVAYLGAVGHLLMDGRLSAAQAMNDHDYSQPGSRALTRVIF